MELSIGQKVAYPGQGVCIVEEAGKRNMGGEMIECYLLRLVGDNSHILVPCEKVEAVGIRELISTSQCRRLINRLAEDFECISTDWKSRSRRFTEMIHSGDVFEAADVFKKLTYLSHEKKLSFREQTLLEKAKFLIVSEIANAEYAQEESIEPKIRQLVETACSKHVKADPVLTAAAAAH